MQFYEFRDDFKAARELNGGKNWPATKLEHFKHMQRLYFEELANDERKYGKPTHTTALGYNQYTSWVHLEELGRPYLKIHPEMAGMMCRTSLDIPSKHLKMPFGAFEIRLPTNNNPLVDDPEHPLRSMVVADQAAVVHLKGPQDLIDGKGERRRVVYLFMDFGESATVDVGSRSVTSPIYQFLNLWLQDDQPLSQSLDQAISKSMPAQGYTPSTQLLRAATSLAIASTFFLARQHTMIFPDIHPRFKQRWERAVKTNDKRELDQIEANNKKLHHFGWSLRSREIELPPPKYQTAEAGSSAESRGRAFDLQFSHIRSGHLRLQPYGPQYAPTHYDVLFIAPTAVRPDLPPRPHPGFVLKDNLRGIHGSTHTSAASEAGHRSH